MNALVPYNDIERMGSAIAKSGLFGIKTPEQAIALMLIAQAEGMHPAIAARDYHVISNRPTLKADAMLARFLQAGGKVSWVTLTNDEVSATFSHPAGGTVTITWTLEEAKRIGLATKDNWRQYPRAMLRSRVVSEGVRTVYPVCVVGVYTPEEVADFDNAPPAMVDVTPPKDDGEPDPDAPANGYALMLPSGEEPYATYYNVRGWVRGWDDMVAKIQNSQKLTDQAKREKISLLAAANAEFIDQLPEQEKNRIHQLIANGKDQANG
jgi:hypothetical protein